MHPQILIPYEYTFIYILLNKIFFDSKLKSELTQLILTAALLRNPYAVTEMVF